MSVYENKTAMSLHLSISEHDFFVKDEIRITLTYMCSPQC